MNTQRNKVYELLKEAGSTGVTGFELTYKHNVKQAPTRIYELRREGIQIEAKPIRVGGRPTKRYLLQPLNRITQPSIQEQIDQLKPVRHANGITTYESPEYFKQRGLV